MSIARWLLLVCVLLAALACEDDPTDLVVMDAGAGSGGGGAGNDDGGSGGTAGASAGSGGAGSGGAGAGSGGAGSGG